MPVNLSAIIDKPWPLARAYLERSLGLQDRLDGVSDDFALGYLSRATRMDLGKICSRGKPCGNSCVPRKRECKSETSKTAKEASARARAKLIEKLKADRDKRRTARAEKKITKQEVSSKNLNDWMKKNIPVTAYAQKTGKSWTIAGTSGSDMHQYIEQIEENFNAKVSAVLDLPTHVRVRPK